MSEPNAEFASLMKRVLAGSKEAAQELHAVYGPHILKVVRQRIHRRLRSKFDSIDFVQDVWASFFTDIPDKREFESPEELISFLAVMARNKVVGAVRTRLQRQKYNVNRETPLADLPKGADRFPAGQQTPSEVMMGEEELEQYLETLPLVHRRIFLLFRQGKNSAQIADELGVSQRTVNRILRKLDPGKPS